MKVIPLGLLASEGQISVGKLTEKHVVIGINGFGHVFILENRKGLWGFGPFNYKCNGYWCNPRPTLEKQVSYKLNANWKIYAFPCKPQADAWVKTYDN